MHENAQLWDQFKKFWELALPLPHTPSPSALVALMSILSYTLFSPFRRLWFHGIIFNMQITMLYNWGWNRPKTVSGCFSVSFQFSISECATGLRCALKWRRHMMRASGCSSCAVCCYSLCRLSGSMDCSWATNSYRRAIVGVITTTDESWEFVAYLLFTGAVTGIWSLMLRSHGHDVSNSHRTDVLLYSSGTYLSTMLSLQHMATLAQNLSVKIAQSFVPNTCRWSVVITQTGRRFGSPRLISAKL